MSENNEISTDEGNIISKIQLEKKREKQIMIILSFIASLTSQGFIIILDKPKLFFHPALMVLLNIALILTTAAIFSGYIGQDIGTLIKIERRKLRYPILFSTFILSSLFLYKLIFLINLLQKEYKLPISLIGLLSLITGLIGCIIMGIYFEIINNINLKTINVVWRLIGSILICFSLSSSLLTSIK